MAKDRIPQNLNEDKRFDSFIDSIEEEIRNENWQRLWEKYGKLATCSICAIIMAVGGYNMWQKQDLKDRESISARYVEIQNLAMMGNVSEAMAQFKVLSTTSQTDYATLAKFEYAALLRRNSDQSAILEYKTLYESKKTNVLIRDLAYVFYVLTCLDLMSTEDLMTNIDGFIQSLKTKYVNGAWTLLAQEAMAFCYLKKGDNNLAKEVLQSLAKTRGITAIMADRVRVLLHSIP
ncbi:MAG: tetratricopeptide repeat protein [Holosporales bacterium]|jgi:hypothetical protein|nr:tetratricopeptide repeat protein [Holosporales bacterium]